MRVYAILDNEKMELEDPYFIQYLLENQCVYLEDKMYTVARIKRVLVKSGNSLDSILEVYLK